MRKSPGFTLIELAISIGILLLLMALAVPSLRGVLSDRRLRHTVDAVDQLVQQAQQRSVLERRPYLLVWNKDSVALRPEALKKDEDAEDPVTVLQLQPGDALQLSLPTSLDDNPPPEWVFWPSGTCDPAIIDFKGNDGSWEASYSPLTARPTLTKYAAR